MRHSFCRIAVVGGIAVGKSTIVEALSRRIQNCQVILEDVSKNVFLEDFYCDMQRWGFHSRISTLAMITDSYLSCEPEKYRCAIFDRCIDELITFAQLHFDSGNMSPKEFDVYRSLYHSITSVAPPVDLFVFCKCSAETSLERIKKRNRSFEQGISIDYLNNLNAYYERWISTLPDGRVEVIDTNSPVDICRIEELVSRYME